MYYAEDLLGSSRVIVQSNGTLCYDADFAPFGAEKSYTSTCPQNYKFEGKERDTETQNDDFGARSYTWRFGRWLSSDWSAVPVAVPYANLANPQTLNLYSMVADDPESFADLDGHAGGGSTTSASCGNTGPANAWGCVSDVGGGRLAAGRAEGMDDDAPSRAEQLDPDSVMEARADQWMAWAIATGNAGFGTQDKDTQQPATVPQQQSTQPAYSIIAGDGTLTLYNGIDKVESFPYTSGLNGDKNPKDKNTGPTPPGAYTVNPKEVSPAGFFRKYLDPRDWGDYRVALHPDAGTNTFTRSGFFIHGGYKRHGSEGCIKVEGPHQNDLFRALQRATSLVPVTVK